LFQDPLTIAALIAGATALAFWLDRSFPVTAKLGASMLVIIFGALLSNSGLVPHDSPVYRGIEGPVTSLAIVYLLLGVRLGDLKQAGPMMFLMFRGGCIPRLHRLHNSTQIIDMPACRIAAF